MANRKLIFFIALLLIVFTIMPWHSFCIAGKEDLPQVPDGYTWKWCENIQAGFLSPDGWFFKEEEKEGTRAVFITKEPIEIEGVYKTGFSANIIKDALKKTGMLPSEYAKQFIDNMKSITESSGIGPISTAPYFKGYSGFFRSKSKDLGLIVQYTLVLGNDITGTLYIFVFESPEIEWDNTWKLGRVIMDNLALESNF